MGCSVYSVMADGTTWYTLVVCGLFYVLFPAQYDLCMVQLTSIKCLWIYVQLNTTTGNTVIVPPSGWNVWQLVWYSRLTWTTHTYLAGEIPWSRRWFTHGEAQPLHSGCADLCEFPKCGNLDCIISGSGGLRSRSPLILCSIIMMCDWCTELWVDMRQAGDAKQIWNTLLRMMFLVHD